MVQPSRLSHDGGLHRLFHVFRPGVGLHRFAAVGLRDGADDRLCRRGPIHVADDVGVDRRHEDTGIVHVS